MTGDALDEGSFTATRHGVEEFKSSGIKRAEGIAVG